MPRKEIQLPRLPLRLPDKLPGEDSISRGVDRVLDLMERNPVLNTVNGLIEKIPIICEESFPTPFGTYKTPEFYIPKLTPARLDGRQREAMKAAVVQDLVSLVSLIPGTTNYAGPILDSITDTADAKIIDTLNPEEQKYYRSYNKVDPSSAIAMMRAMVRTEKER